MAQSKKTYNVSEAIRAKIILNTKHITLNTEHKTHNNLLNSQNEIISNSHDEMRDMSSPADASGLASLPLGGVICSGVGNSGLVNEMIEYLAVTLKTPDPERPERLEVNLDFRRVGSKQKQFNKLIFNLVAYKRKREFMENIPSEHHDWIGYSTALSQMTKNCFIGKGRNRGSFTPNASKRRTKVIPETAMVIDGDTLMCHIWIEGAYLALQLNDWSDKANLFCQKAEYIKQDIDRTWKRGDWL